MVASMQKVGAAVGVMRAADLMAVLRMRVPVQTPTAIDVAVVGTPIDAGAREDPEQDSRIEDSGVKPVPRPAGVQQLPRKQAC